MGTIKTNKTAGTALLAHTQQATAAITIGSWVDVSLILEATVSIHLGRTIATALGNQVKFRVEGSMRDSGSTVPTENDLPVLLDEFTSGTGTTTATSTTLNDAAANAADTVITLTSGSGIAAGDIIYLRETGTPANSEWCRVKSVATNDVTLEEGLRRGHTNGINVADQGEIITRPVPRLSNFKRVRLVVDTASAASGQTVDVIAYLSTLNYFDTVA